MTETQPSTALAVVTPDEPTFAMQQYLASVSSPATFAAQQQLAVAYDAACAALVGANDVQVEGARSFKKKSAWRKLARHFGISTQVVRVEREAADDGTFIATVIVRARAPWGQSAEAVGACAGDEATGRRTITIADAIATAETRATNRAVSNLVAMGEVSAEEMSKETRKDSRAATGGPVGQGTTHVSGGASRSSEPANAGAGQSSAPAPLCPKCGGAMWDNRATKRTPSAPDFKCRNAPKVKGGDGCEGVIWPPKDGKPSAPANAERSSGYNDAEYVGALPPSWNEPDDLPF